MAAISSRLFHITTCLSLLLAAFAVHTGPSRSRSPATDPDIVQYLTEVFDGVKGSGRKPINEELNLLPDEREGFANMVRCFSADHLGEYCAFIITSTITHGTHCINNCKVGRFMVLQHPHTKLQCVAKFA